MGGPEGKEAVTVARTPHKEAGADARAGAVAGPLLIDQFMPECDFSIVFSRVFRAPPERSFETFVESDLFQIPLFRVLIGARGIPQLLADAIRRRHSAVPSSQPTFRLRDMPSIGWIVLGERPGSELTFGQVSKAWKGRASPPDEPVTPATFLGFDQPGFAKVVESTRVDPYGERASIVTAESRVLCTDDDSRRRFRRYWLAVTPFTHLMRFIALPALARKAESAS
jgi:hypothetical protein